MKAVAIRTFGAPEGLAVIDLPVPAPEAGQVLIATEAAGVGGVDAVIRRGALAGHGFPESYVPGAEVAGTVTAVGPGVDPAWTGRRVWGFTGSVTGGGYAEYAVAAAEELVALPEGLSAVDAVGLGNSGMTAHFALRRARFAPGETVLIRGAAGSIGIPAVQLAARGGAAAVAVTTSSAERGERLRRLGATHVLDRSGEGGQDAPDEYDVIIDVVAGEAMPAFLGRLAADGRMVAVGVVGGPPPADLGAALMATFRKSPTLAAFSADTVPPADRQAVRNEQFAAAARGTFQTVVHEVLPLDEAVTAHRKLDTGEVFGRIALTP